MRGLDDLAINARDAVCGACRHIEFDIGHAALDAADVDSHVDQFDQHAGIASQSQSGDVEQRRDGAVSRISPRSTPGRPDDHQQSGKGHGNQDRRECKAG
jgi:hypothetical protein